MNTDQMDATTLRNYCDSQLVGHWRLLFINYAGEWKWNGGTFRVRNDRNNGSLSIEHNTMSGVDGQTYPHEVKDMMPDGDKWRFYIDWNDGRSYEKVWIKVEFLLAEASVLRGSMEKDGSVVPVELFKYITGPWDTQPNHWCDPDETLVKKRDEPKWFDAHLRGCAK